MAGLVSAESNRRFYYFLRTVSMMTDFDLVVRICTGQNYFRFRFDEL